MKVKKQPGASQFVPQSSQAWERNQPKAARRTERESVRIEKKREREEKENLISHFNKFKILKGKKLPHV